VQRALFKTYFSLSRLGNVALLLGIVVPLQIAGLYPFSKYDYPSTFFNAVFLRSFLGPIRFGRQTEHHSYDGG